jgi:YD repeat-containing protein
VKAFPLHSVLRRGLALALSLAPMLVSAQVLGLVEHDAQGRIRLCRYADGSQAEFSYDQATGKLSMVKESARVRLYRYNDKGDLVRAWSSAGEQIDLRYDAAGRIVQMEAALGAAPVQLLDFRYSRSGRAGKPVDIHLRGQGRLKVRYDASGEVEKVVSEPADPQTALHLAQIFQHLMGLVRDGGVEMGL